MLARFLKDAWLVMVAALVFGLLVASVNGLLSERIAANEREKLQSQLRLLMPEAARFEPAPQDAESPDYYVGRDEEGAILGYAVPAGGAGFADRIGLLVAFAPDLATLRGIAVLASNETPGFGDRIKEASFRARFVGVPADGSLEVVQAETEPQNEIMSITGATISSQAVTDIVNAAAAQVRELVKP